MPFASLNLDSNISKAITACGYGEPTPIQAQSIPAILEGRDVVACAQTGTGKTAAFVWPALHHLSQEEVRTTKGPKNPRILILTPTRELASQITKAAAKYGKFLRFNIVSLVGGMPYHHQIKDLSRGADILVATPGRLMDHIENGRVHLSEIEMLILDEADRMLDMGFIDDVQYIAKLTPEKRQTLLFSATVDNKLSSIVRSLLNDPVRIDLSDKKIAAPLIKQELYKANSPHHKARLLKHFLNDENIFKAIIFSATKANADKLAYDLRNDGFAAAPLHGDLKQNVRNRTIEQLRQGKIQYLVATDVAARGIDISDITHVINYDLPKFCEDYVHRIGRTGRAGKTGTAISFVLPSDTRHVQRIERYIGQRFKIIQNVVINDGYEAKAESSESPKRPERDPNAPRLRFEEYLNSAEESNTKKHNAWKERKEGRSQDDRSSQPSVRFKERRFANDDYEQNDRAKKRDFRGRSDDQQPRSHERSDRSEGRARPEGRGRFESRGVEGRSRFEGRGASEGRGGRPEGGRRFEGRNASEGRGERREGGRRFESRGTSEGRGERPEGGRRFEGRNASEGRSERPEGGRRFESRGTSEGRGGRPEGRSTSAGGRGKTSFRGKASGEQRSGGDKSYARPAKKRSSFRKDH